MFFYQAYHITKNSFWDVWGSMCHVPPLPIAFPHCGGQKFLPSLPQLVPPAALRFWELSTFERGKHRGRAGGAAGACAAGPPGAECRVGEPLAERPLCPALPDARPPPAARICAHRTCLHPELHPGTILGCEGTGRRVSKGPGFLSWLKSWGVGGEGLRSHLEDTWTHP